MYLSHSKLLSGAAINSVISVVLTQTELSCVVGALGGLEEAEGTKSDTVHIHIHSQSQCRLSSSPFVSFLIKRSI